MPIPERAGPELSNARLVEFITERRQQRARRRRQLIVLGATAGMGLIVGLALMAGALLSFNRFPARSRSATVVAPPPVPSTPAPQAPARAADLAAPPPPSPPARTVEPDQSPPTAAGLPESRLTPSGPADEMLGDPDPARRTAGWLVQTYGRVEAENRALIVAEFYSGERRAFWQRVLADVRQAPER
jgi:hypothetical protein